MKGNIFLFRWLTWLTLAMTGLWTFLFMCTPVWENDIWWHLKAGQYILEKWEWPRQALFTYPYPERLWIDLHWLYQISQYVLYQWGGFTALITITSLCITTASVLALLPMLQRKKWLWASFFMLLASFLLNQRAIIRPEVYSYVLFSVYLLCLESYRRHGKHWIFVLPLCQVVWTNVQALFILGLALIGIYYLDEIKERFTHGQAAKESCLRLMATPLALIMVLCVAVCFINPYGTAGVLFPLTLFGVIQGTTPVWKEIITEFWPLWQVWPDWHFIPACALWIMILFPLMILWRGFRVFPLRYVLLYAAFGALAVLAMRNLSFWVLAILFVQSQVESLWPWRLPRWPSLSKAWTNSLLAGWAAILAGMFYALLTQQYYSYVGDARQFGLSGTDTTRYPHKAVAYIQQKRLPGQLFHYLDDSGYLIWKLYPHYRVFIDTRIDPVIMTPEHFLRYLRMCQDREYFEAMAAKYQINTVLVRTHGAHQQWMMTLVFEGNPHWKQEFYDAEEGAVVLTKNVK